MTRDAERLLKCIVKHSKEIRETSFWIDIGEIEKELNIYGQRNKLLDELEFVGMLAKTLRQSDGSVYIPLTTEGLEYFNDLKFNDENKIILNVYSGGQVNISSDNGVIEAVQNNWQKNMQTNQFESNKKDIGVKKKKVFISYSWVPESNKAWVINLVNRLELDGVEVVVDFKDLKLGHDIYSFMQRTVNDDTIDKVLIICNSGYKYKADNRQGGVGDESAIITSQVYGNATQEKFIPVVNEKDEEGKPFLPNYLVSRLYADLTDFENGYNELLINILEEQS